MLPPTELVLHYHTSHSQRMWAMIAPTKKEYNKRPEKKQLKDNGAYLGAQLKGTDHHGEKCPVSRNLRYLAKLHLQSGSRER